MNKINKLIFLFFAVSAVICGCGRKQQEIVIIPDIERNHLQRNHIFGNVCEIISESYAMPADSTASDTNGNPLSTVIHKYSPDGYLTEVIKIGGSGDTISKQIITYSPEAKELTRETYNSSGNLDSKTIFDYNHFGFKSKETLYIADSVIYSIDYKTDGAGNIIEMKRHGDGLTLLSRIAYNKAGLVARIEEYEPSGKIFKYATIEYDNYGDEVNRRVFKTGDELIEYTYTEYNQQGHTLKKIYEDRLHSIREVAEYSAHDKAGNWTYEKKSINNKPAYCRKRIIKYY